MKLILGIDVEGRAATNQIFAFRNRSGVRRCAYVVMSLLNDYTYSESCDGQPS
jgi:hypothetical protein